MARVRKRGGHALVGFAALGIVLLMLTLGAVLLVLGRIDQRIAHQGVEEVVPQLVVTSRVAGVDGPAVKIGQVLNVSARKCNITKDPITITADASWIAVQPPGLGVVIGKGSAVRKPGCTSFQFKFTLPDQVTARVKALSSTVKGQTWQITGTDTPTDGSPAILWTSQAFTVVP